MRELNKLIEEAGALARAELSVAETEVARQMQICNGCRYCEGFCAVFPAMTRRLEFGAADVHYLANLCHNCGACLHACQYAPPHEFAINVPKAMAQVRGQTYTDFAWPAACGKLYQRNGLTVSLALAFGLGLFLVLVMLQQDTLSQRAVSDGFYGVLPHNAMVGLFAPVFLWACLALALGVTRFWREVTPVSGAVPLNTPASLEATHAVLRLKYLDGGHGEGCHNEDDAWTQLRRRFHHLTFYGFMLCFAATSVATLYHYVLDWPAPYALPSLPKLLGAVGGVSLLLGSCGLAWLNLRRHPDHGDPAQKPMDLGFIALLGLISLSGLLLWLLGGTGAMPWLLAFHLGTVMALFLTLPYGKFAHGIFRTAALLRFAVEKRQPNRLGLGGE